VNILIENNLVSIITPVYNSELFISETIESVISQDYEFWELILVDDCSSDDSVKIINQYVQQDSRIRLIQLYENSGAALARNAAINDSKGRYLTFIDSDDVWLPSFLSEMLVFMSRNNAAFVFSGYNRVDVNRCFLSYFGVPEKIHYKALLKTCVISCLTVILDSEKVGRRYFPEYTKREDFAYWLLILKDVQFAFGLNKPLALYRCHRASSSSNKFDMAIKTWEMYRKIEGLSLFVSSYYFSHYAVRGLLRNKTPRLARLLRVLK
jgi:teichuronic acid biosynthesis glycosyltransferase TuaG